MWILGIKRIALGLLAALLLGIALGAYIARQMSRAELQAVTDAAAAQQLATVTQAQQRLTVAAAASDAALTAQAAREIALNETNRRLQHALRTQASARPCFSTATRGLLQQHPAFYRTELPAAASGSVVAAAAAAADPVQSDSQSDSSERDIAEWSLAAAGAYETCRARIDALRRWDAGVNNGR